MILNSHINTVAPHAVQSSPVGNTGVAPKDPLVQNSSFRPVESLSSPQKTHIPLKERLNHQDSFSDVDQPSGLSLSGNNGASSAEGSVRQEEQAREARIQQDRAKQSLLREQREISQLSARDREVRAHEQAHAAVGGQYAGAPSYQFERGPDGINYAVAGEVSISTGKESTPQETIQKAQVVRRAALAPAEPSPQDRRVASIATRMESEARAELAELQREEVTQAKETQEEKETEESKTPNGIETRSDDEARGTAGEPNTRQETNSVSSTSTNSISSLKSTEPPVFDDVGPFRPARQSVADLQNSSAVNEILSIAQPRENAPGTLLDQLA